MLVSMRRALRGRAALILACDAIMAGASITLAYLLRVGWPTAEARTFVLVLGPLTFGALAAPVFSAFRIQSYMWRHFSVRDVVPLGTASVVAILAGSVVTMLLGGLVHLPGSVLLIQWPVLLLLLLGGRLLWQVFSQRRSRRDAGSVARRQVLLVGTGASCATLLRGVSSGRPAMVPVGILAADDRDVGRLLHGVPVLGRIEELTSVVERLTQQRRRPEQVIVTELLSRPVLMRLLGEAGALRMATVKLPEPEELRAGVNASRAPFELISLQSLLRRPQVQLDRRVVDELAAGRRVLVTGAGGSIGQELVRLLAAANPARLAMLDNCEYNLYSIDLDIAERFPAVARSVWLADVRQASRIRQVVELERPELVFHAAALKHVPMVEANPMEGVLSNVVGTRNVADAALGIGALAMVQISTDKAVNPTSVMGATKRLAELYCQALDLEAAAEAMPGRRATRFVTVRFGNVLGSSGSVVPLFQRQIDLGGPVTVTHPEIRRYFMTIREACELVLQASTHALRDDTDRGTIFVLDMGEAVRVIDVARQMIRLSGKEPDRDIEVKIVGLRPGEKLFEELFDSNELRLAGPADGVLAARSVPRRVRELAAIVCELEQMAVRGSELPLRTLLADSVPSVRARKGGDIKGKERTAA